MPLSRRLVLILLAVAAVGLLTLSLVSYFALRSYLSDRVDQQARDAVPLVVRTMASQIAGLPTPAEALTPPTGDGGSAADGPVGPLLPAGTYGQIDDADGQTLAARVVSGDRDLPMPDLPDPLPANAGFDGNSPLDVPSEGGGSGFRVATQSGPGGETVAAAIPLTDLDATLSRLRTIEILVTLGILAALAAVSYWAVRVGLRPLVRIEETAGEIAAGDMSHRVAEVDERTEVGRLGIAFNEMLSRLERAFADQRASEERLRRFLADASHELRTPLSSIRGYAELFRLGASADPDDLERSMHRIESESARMSGLVDDLLTLARLDEVREPRRAPVDLAAVAADACADALVTAPDRDIVLTAPQAAPLSGDPDQLRQVVNNLIGNAVAHAPEGPIEVGVATDADHVELTVRDHGPGLPAGAEDSVFERFWRTGEARTRASGGAGLGLAIVAGVAEAHGGGVTASNASGGGAVFVVTLPSHADAGPD
jgi:two-component system, OmpR family, sensor kinase